MKHTTMKIMEKRGFSVHQADIVVREDHEGVRTFAIHGPKGCDIELPWDDVLEAGMEFVRKVAEE